MYKKIFAIGLTMSMVLGLTACSGGQGAQTSGTDTATTEQTSTGSGDAVVLKISNPMSENSPYQEIMQTYADKVSELTDGHVVCEIYSGAVLGDDREQMEGMSLGTSEIALIAPTVMEQFTSDAAFFNVPFLIQSREHGQKILDSSVAADLEESLKEHGYNHIAWLETGTRNIFTKEPVESVDDLQGIKLRVMENSMHIKAFEALGCIPVPMAFTEIYTALQQGTIDGLENVTSDCLTEGFYESTKYITMSEHLWNYIGVGISDKALEKVPEEYRDALVEAGDYIESISGDVFEEENDDVIKQLEEKGVTFLDIDKAELKAKVDLAIQEYLDQIGQEKIDLNNSLAE